MKSNYIQFLEFCNFFIANAEVYYLMTKLKYNKILNCHDVLNCMKIINKARFEIGILLEYLKVTQSNVKVENSIAFNKSLFGSDLNESIAKSMMENKNESIIITDICRTNNNSIFSIINNTSKIKIIQSDQSPGSQKTQGKSMSIGAKLKSFIYYDDKTRDRLEREQVDHVIKGMLRKIYKNNNKKTLPKLSDMNGAVKIQKLNTVKAAKARPKMTLNAVRAATNSESMKDLKNIRIKSSVKPHYAAVNSIQDTRDMKLEDVKFKTKELMNEVYTYLGDPERELRKDVDTLRDAEMVADYVQKRF